jgi:ADP-ribosylglycohydrolase
MSIRTSSSHPLRIDTLSIPGIPGTLGLTLCPGKRGPSSIGSHVWDRSLLLDAAGVADWGADLWICLMEPDELALWEVASLPAVAGTVSRFFNLPITDVQAPDHRFDSAWKQVGPIIHSSLRAGGKVLLHCRGGLGRTGTVAARLLVEFGLDPDQAIRRVRAARPGAIETVAQEAWVRRLSAQRGIACPPAAPAVPVTPVVTSHPAGGRRAERARAGLLGLLVGDALGVPHEFKTPAAILPREQIEMVVPDDYPRSHVRVPPGTWSDDGAQALCLLDSLLSRGYLDPNDLARRLLAWRDTGYMAVDRQVFDIGIQTQRAVDRIRSGVPALEAGDRAPGASGNGSLMRVLSLALWHRSGRFELFESAMLQSQVTHGSLQAQLCCALYCGVADSLLEGLPRALAWQATIESLREHCSLRPAYREVLERDILDSPRRFKPGGSGHVVDALWSAHACLQQDDYASVVRAAIALGDDTDTTAAIAGGLAGIVFGEAGIPERWRSGLRGQGLSAPLLNGLEVHHG